MKRRYKIGLAAAGLAVVPAVALVGANMTAADPVLAQVPIGATAPGFRGTDVNGRPVSLAELRGKTVVLEWSNPDCPSVKAHYESGNIEKTQAAAANDGVVWITINSSAQGKQGYLTPAEARDWAASQPSRRPAAYLLDPSGVVGRAYGATATPHMYVIDDAGKLVYRGAIDDNPSADKDGIGSARNHVLAALGEVKARKPVSVPTSRPYGCSVKYSA